MGPRLLHGPILQVCSTTPRFSYKVSKCACTGSVGWRTGACTDPSGHGVRARVGTGDGYTGWVREGLYRGTTQPPRFARGECPTSEAGPVRPCRGLEWVGWDRVRVPGAPGDPPLRGPVGTTPWSLPGHLPGKCRLWANKARFRLIICKVSQNGIVSPKYA